MTKSVRKRNEPNDSVEVARQQISETPNLDGDWLNFYLLILLYIIQGFSLGISFALPLILQSKKTVTYNDQAFFSIAIWSASFKLLWAPLVDALYLQRVGRRKSWLIPLQIFVGLLWLCLSSNIDEWLPDVGKPNLNMIVIVLLIINLLSATLDIVVGGWALTMLKKKNVSYASTCHTVGVSTGTFIGSVCFILLVSEEFLNTHFRTTPETGGLISMKNFFFYAGISVLSVTVAVATIKKEKDVRLVDGYVEIGVFQNYVLLWDILRMRRIQVLIVALLTTRIGFAAVEGVSNIKFIESRVSKDDITIITIIAYGIRFIMPVFVSKYTTNSKPMNYYLKVYPIRLLWAINYAFLIHFTPKMIHKNDIKGVQIFHLLFGAVYLINDMMEFFMVLAIISFFCRICDPRYGGTYMTLFCTFYFVGYSISNTIALNLVSILTFRGCSNDAQNYCSTTDLQSLCKLNGGECEIYMDGFNLVVSLCMFFGFAWYFFFRSILRNYQLLSLSHWMVNVVPLHINRSMESNDL